MHASMSSDGWQVLLSPILWSAGGATREAALFWKIADANDAANQGNAIPGGIITVHNGSTTGDFFIGAIYSFTADDGFAEDPVEDLTQNSASGTSVTMNTVTPEGDNRLGVSLVMVANNNVTLGASTGESGADWVEETQKTGAGSLNYIWQIQTCDLSDGEEVSGGASALSGSADWVNVSFALAPADV
jgi:hypothetical protein